MAHLPFARSALLPLKKQGVHRQELPLHDRPVSEGGQLAQPASHLGFLYEVMDQGVSYH